MFGYIKITRVQDGFRWEFEVFNRDTNDRNTLKSGTALTRKEAQEDANKFSFLWETHKA